MGVLPGSRRPGTDGTPDEGARDRGADRVRFGRVRWSRGFVRRRPLETLRVLSVWAQSKELSAAHHWPVHSHPRMAEFYFVDQGGIVINVAGRRMPVREAQAVLFLPRQSHAMRAEAVAPANVILIHFTASNLLRVYPGLKAVAGRPLSMDPERLRSLNQLCRHLRENDRPDAQPTYAALNGLLLALEGTPAQRRAAHPGETSFATRMRSYIRLRLPGPLRLPDIARGLGVSLSTLCHRARAEAGETPHRMVLRLRLELAKQALRKPGASVKQAASAAGFRSPTALARAFRRAEGTTPDRYARSLRPD